MYDKICKICDKKYTTDVINRAYCSDICKKAFYDKKIENRRKKNFELFGTYDIKNFKNLNINICKICNKEFVNYASFKQHLFHHHKDITNKEYYDKYLLKPTDGICSICSKPTKFIRISIGYNKTCGSNTCMAKQVNNEIVKKYGVKNISQAVFIKQKKKETCQKNWGFDSYLESDIGKHNIKQSWKNKTKDDFKIMDEKRKLFYNKKYGVDYYLQTDECIEKRKNTCQERYNCDNVFQVEEIKDKCKKTNLERYNCEYISQNEEIFLKAQKTGRKWVEYVLPSGKIVKVQGYEWKYLDRYFADKNNKECDIIIHPKQNLIGQLWYFYKNCRKRYFPDFYIPKDNKIIEVKSTWTMKKDYDKNLLKEMSCLDYGFAFEFKIYEQRD